MYALALLIALTAPRPFVAASGAPFECTIDAASLRFGVGAYTAAGVGLPNAPANESLATAICCDENYAGVAEPRALYASSDLFEHANATGLTTFYDSACGAPLFVAPQDRSFADWYSETRAHGWPSFRPAELASPDAVRVVNSSVGRLVYSSCGTLLGTDEPDDDGTRYCIDLVCISGAAPMPVVLGELSSSD